VALGDKNSLRRRGPLKSRPADLRTSAIVPSDAASRHGVVSKFHGAQGPNNGRPCWLRRQVGPLNSPPYDGVGRQAFSTSSLVKPSANWMLLSYLSRWVPRVSWFSRPGRVRRMSVESVASRTSGLGHCTGSASAQRRNACLRL
jgi:hypothetical protein